MARAKWSGLVFYDEASEIPDLDRFWNAEL
jgi:hypothetical protein